MTLAFLLLATLCASDDLGRDAGVPLWAPMLKPSQVEDAASYGLRRTGDGYVWEHSKFDARVGHDGIVHFKDKHGSVSVGVLGWISKLNGDKSKSSEPPALRDPAASRGGPWSPQAARPSPLARRTESEEVCPPNSSCYILPSASLLEVRGTFDLTEEIMRMLGQDPYALDKARFLSATFEFRIKLAIEARKIDLKQALDHLPARLDQLWSDSRYSARERRRILYELWSEMDQSPEGERAARMIVDFIRRRLPCGSPDTYSGAELQGFAKRKGERRFGPAEECTKEPGTPRED
jgi:hypothetical protein